MQKTKIIFKITVIVLSVLVACVSFAHAKYLRTLEAKDDEVSGSFTLILYGGRHVNDLETIAILDREGDQYEFEPYAPEFDYKVKKGLPAGDALNEAKQFVSFHNAFWRSQLSKILDDKGNIIGYEVRPLYRPFVYGRDDLLEVHYRIKDGKVIVYISLVPEVFNNFFFGDLPGSSSGGH
jgi:hypothetical protein